MKKVLSVFIILFILIWISFWLDIPKPDWYVLDQANVLSQQEELALEQQISQIWQNTDIEIAVLTVNSLEWEDSFSYSIKVTENRLIGDKEKDNWILLFFSIEDRERRIQVWYWLEWIITDNIAKRLWERNITENFRNWNYYNWIKNTISDIYNYINQDPKTLEYINASTNNISNWLSKDLDWFFWIYVMTMFFLANKMIVKRKKEDKKKKIKIWKKWRINFGILWLLWSAIIYFILLPWALILSGILGFWWLLIIIAILSSSGWLWWMFFWWAWWSTWWFSSGWFWGFGWWSFGWWWAGWRR